MRKKVRGEERERVSEREREREKANSCKSLMFVPSNPLQSSPHFKLHILCSVRPFSQGQLTCRNEGVLSEGVSK